MKRRMVTLVLALLLCAALGSSAYAQEDTVCGAFSDVRVSAWYHDGVHYALENGLMNGVGGGQFAPGGRVTRAMLVTVLYRNAGSPAVSGQHPFRDVAPGRYYSRAVAWAYETGIVNGVTATTFEPDSPVTRQQIAAILFRAAGQPALRRDLGRFSDRNDVSSYAVSAMQWAVARGLINGYLAENPAVAAMEQYRKLLDAEQCFQLADITGDGVPELFVERGDCEANYRYTVYTIRGGAVRELGSFASGWGALRYSESTGNLYFSAGHMGYYTLYCVRSVNGTLTLVKLDEAQMDPDAEARIAEYLNAMGACGLTGYTVQSFDLLAAQRISEVRPRATATRAEIATILMRYLTQTDSEPVPPQLSEQDVEFLAATEQRVYYGVPSMVGDGQQWGWTVFSCRHDGSDAAVLGAERMDLTVLPDYLLLTTYRSDVSPFSMTVIDRSDRVVLQREQVMSAVELGGALYTLELPDGYGGQGGTTVEVHRYDGAQDTVVHTLTVDEPSLLQFHTDHLDLIGFDGSTTSRQVLDIYG